MPRPLRTSIIDGPEYKLKTSAVLGLDAWRWLVLLAFLCVEAWLASLLVFQERRVVHQWLTPFDVTEPTLPWYVSASLLCWKTGSSCLVRSVTLGGGLPGWTPEFNRRMVFPQHRRSALGANWANGVVSEGLAEWKTGP